MSPQDEQNQIEDGIVSAQSGVQATPAGVGEQEAASAAANSHPLGTSERPAPVQHPSVGRIVRLVENNGEQEHAAVITRVVDTDAGVVNLHVFRDIDSEPGNSELRAVPFGGHVSHREAPATCWYWPPRN